MPRVGEHGLISVVSLTPDFVFCGENASLVGFYGLKKHLYSLAVYLANTVRCTTYPLT